VSHFFIKNDSKDPSQITPVEISEYLSYVRESGGQSKYNQARSALSSFFDFHIRCGRISINPVLAFKTKAVPLPSLRFLPDEQIYIRVVSAEIKLRNQIMLHCAFVLGLRLFEILNLKGKSFIIGFNGDVFVSINGKGGKIREVFVPDWLWRLIGLYLADNLIQPNEFLFFAKSDRNKSLSQYSAYKIFILAGKRVGLTIPMNPHKYRHGHEVTAYSRGVNLKALKDEMGHGNLQALLRYIEQARFASPSSTFAEPGAMLAINSPS
jgi:integrase/recombinase XerD